MTTGVAASGSKFTDTVAGVRSSGYAIARGALPPHWVVAYRNLVAQWFDQLDQRIASGEKNTFLEIYSRQSGMSLGMRSEADTQPPMGIRSFLTLLYDGGLWSAGFFNEELGALLDACSIRRQKPDARDRALGYHQDSAVINSPDGVVFWIPLDPIDESTPGLEVVPNWQKPMMQHAWNKQNGYLETSELITQKSVTVTMKRGDVLVFALPTPHRTFLAGGMFKTRYSIDLRAVPLSKIPTTYRGDVIVPR